MAPTPPAAATSRAERLIAARKFRDSAVGDSDACSSEFSLFEAMNNHSAPGDRGGADALLGLKRDQVVRVQFESGTLL